MNQDYTDLIQQVSQVLLQAIKEREFNLAQMIGGTIFGIS